MQVIDNFLSPTYFKTLKQLLEGNMFDWYYQEHISSNFDNSKQSFGFSSWIVDIDGNLRKYGDLFTGFLTQLQDIYPDCNRILRCRADMVVSANKTHLHSPHIDINDIPHYSCVYYVNESDGNTVIYNEKSETNDFEPDLSKLTIKTEIEPVPNRLVIFDGQYIHSGHSPVEYKRRIILNTNIERK